MIRRIVEMPWLLVTELRRYLMLPLFRVRFLLSGVAWSRRMRVLGMPIIQRHRGSTIQLGTNVYLRSWRTTNPLAPNHPVVLATRTADAKITIGDNCGFTGTTIVAAESITIGNNVLVGGNASIVDTDFHPLTPNGRAEDLLAGKNRPIVIEDDVFVGMNALILKGVTIGKGSVVGAGSVVTRDVPPHTVVAGNPAQVVKQLPTYD